MSLDVRIDKCDNPEAWYKNHVGKILICESTMSVGGVILSQHDPNLREAVGLEGVVFRELFIWFIPYEDCTILNVTGMPPFNQEDFKSTHTVTPIRFIPPIAK